MEHVSTLRTKYLSFNQDTVYMYRVCYLMNAVIINFILILYFGHEVIVNDSVTSSDFDEHHMVFKILGTLHITMGVFFLLFWLKVIGKVDIMDGWREIYKEYSTYFDTLSKTHKNGPLYQYIYSLLKKNIVELLSW